MQGSSVFKAICTACKQAGLFHFIGGSQHSDNLRLNILKEDADKFGRLVFQTVGETSGLQIKSHDRIYAEPRILLSGPQVEEIRGYDMFVPERGPSVTQPALIFGSIIEISFWAEAPSYSKTPFLVPDRVNSRLSRIPKSKTAELNGRSVDEPAELSGLSTNFDIDVVYTWVNDADPDWLAQKNKYQQKYSTKSAGRALLKERFKNRDELRFSLRSIEMFAPFVRNIYLVTADQIPAWLNTSHPRLKLVSHREIFRSPKMLPTFNSSAIETQLHHIDGLSEHFMYFNDDMFLGQLCEREDFFLANGCLRYFPSDQRVYPDHIDSNSEEYLQADRNAVRLFERDFGFSPRQIMLHAPYPAQKSLLWELEKRYQAEFDGCAEQKFRSSRDLRPIAFMQPHYGFLRQQAIPSQITNRYLGLWKVAVEEQMRNVLYGRRYKTFCINDVGLQQSREQQIDASVVAFLESYFPFKSSFEL
jgi:hypothetical protein